MRRPQHPPSPSNLPTDGAEPASEDAVADVSPALGEADTADLPHEFAPHERRIRSFVTRAGRLSNAQRRALEVLGPRFVLPFAPHEQGELLDWRATFGREAPRIVEIGFGMGASTAEIAAMRPADNFLGIEVHEPGVGALLKLMEERDLHNIRILQHDAVEIFKQALGPASLDGVHIFFPDPWHKKRHHKRRLIQAEFVALLASRLKPGGYLHCATDWQNYAQQMLEVLSAEPLLANREQGYAPRPDYRPVTKFEQRGLRLGHGVWDLIFTRRPG